MTGIQSINLSSNNIKDNQNYTQEQNYKKPGAGAIIGGAIAGSAVSKLISLPHQFIAPGILNKMVKLSSSLTKDEFNKVEQAAADAIKNTGLKDKGVEIIKATSENSEQISQIMSGEVNRGIAKFLPKNAKKFLESMFTNQMKNGHNACYTFASKKIIMPEKDLALAFFHEAGHAMNANLSKVGKALQGCRSLAILALPISMIALFKSKKAPDEKPKNNLDKATTFVKDNAGKLTFAAFLPTIIEEGLASIKGNKLAKELLSPELAKKVAKTNALGFSTYLMIASLSGIGICLGSKVKDKIASKKPIDNNK